MKIKEKLFSLFVKTFLITFEALNSIIDIEKNNKKI